VAAEGEEKAKSHVGRGDGKERENEDYLLVL
jgi:hypothetical protein